VLAALFERRQARVWRIPLVAIHDSPDQAAVCQWLEDFMARPVDVFIVLTGEGLRRLQSAARRLGREQDFIAALARCCCLCRGPKPGRVLKAMGLQTDLLAAAPTTEGVIETLRGLDLAGKRVAVQLYGQDPNLKLMACLDACGLDGYSTVAPYIYADEAETSRVEELIRDLAAGRLDMIAFTSQPQWHRLLKVARGAGLESTLQAGLTKVLVAAVGPVVADEISKSGCQVAVMPEQSFFMKPLVRAAEQAFAARPRPVEE
jgi:uroporphyrinogen-III synthase